MGYPAASELISSHRQMRRLSKKWQQKRYATLKYRMLLAHVPDPNYSYRTMLSLFTIANDSIGMASVIFFITVTFFPAPHLLYASIVAAMFYSSFIGYDSFQKNCQVDNKNSNDSFMSVQNKSQEVISLIKDIRHYNILNNTDIFLRINELNKCKKIDLSLKNKFDKDRFINNSKTFLSAAGAGFVLTKFVTVGFFLTFNFVSPPGMILISSYLLYATALTKLKDRLDQTTNDHQEKLKIEKARIISCQENDLNQLSELKNPILDVAKLTRNSSTLFYKLKDAECAPSTNASSKVKNSNSNKLYVTTCFDKKLAKKTNN